MNRAKNIINACKVYKDGYLGRGVRIAVLDTGVASHTDLKGKVIYFKDLVNKRRSPYDDNGHGTHISGILCGSGRGSMQDISGMAPEAELVVFKVLDSKGNGQTEDVIYALQWLKENYLRYRVRLINFSMGFLPNSSVDEQRVIMSLLEELWDLGVTVVTAAGNNGPKRFSVTVPGVSKKLITVGACDDEYVKNGLKKGYSGKGPTQCCVIKPEVLAPGTQIMSLSKESGYTRKSGSSMATPVVCGALALCCEKRRQLSPTELKLYLYQTCVRICENEKVLKSWGIINVDELMEQV